MIVTYTPDGQDAQRFEFIPDRVRSKRAEEIEKAAGSAAAPMPFEAWTLAVQQGSARARRVLLWHLLSQTHPKLRLADVDFAMGELLVEMTVPELVELREQVAGSRRISGDDREQVLEALDGEIEAEREKAAERDRARVLVDGDRAEANMLAAYTQVAGTNDVLPYDGADRLAVDGEGKAR